MKKRLRKTGISEIVETENRRIMVSDTDPGEKISKVIEDLIVLLSMYRSGQM